MSIEGEIWTDDVKRPRIEGETQIEGEALYLNLNLFIRYWACMQYYNAV